MFKLLSFGLYLIINKKDIQFVHKLLDSPSYTGSLTTVKIANFYIRKCDMYLIFAQYRFILEFGKRKTNDCPHHQIN